MSSTSTSNEINSNNESVSKHSSQSSTATEDFLNSSSDESVSAIYTTHIPAFLSQYESIESKTAESAKKINGLDWVPAELK